MMSVSTPWVRCCVSSYILLYTLRQAEGGLLGGGTWASVIKRSQEAAREQPDCTLYLVRHGESQPNVQQKIVSGLQEGKQPQNGLTPAGVEQAHASGAKLKEILLKQGVKPENTVILTSPLSRAKQTAEAIQEHLECELREDSGLRERWFGDWEGAHHSHYQDVWAQDALSPRHREFGVESPEAVAQRTTAVVSTAERELMVKRRYYSGPGMPFSLGPSALVIVSHGDALQILQCALLGRDLCEHRQLPHLENCGIRVLRPPKRTQ